MALQIYINSEVQAFKKFGNNDILFGIQVSTTYSLLPITGAIYSGSNTTATSVKLIKINKFAPHGTISETTLSNSVITYSGGEFKIDPDVAISSMDECIYYLQFQNGENIYKSEPFLVQAFNQHLASDQTFWTADSTIITADQTEITI